MSDNPELLEQIKAERSFIHDLATPIMIAQGMVDAVESKLPEDSAERERLSKAAKALAKMATILKDRRQALIEQNDQVKHTS